jgi:NitT/TauT family transport system ATP-binding protein
MVQDGRPVILDVRGVRRGFVHPGGGELLVLENVDLTLREGEIVGLLGRSGSGKSTLLRIIAGLIPPSGGRIGYEGAEVDGPAPGIAMVFQSFALFPWLTVQGNVEIGLEAQGVPPAERRARALAAIDLIGLDGFESAYPRELSGGMRQRVGFARAVVVHPRVMLMDEPFSALDVLTAETLRTDFLDLWGEGRMPIGAVLMVTHNIEEAVFMCDRLLVLASNPGRVVAEIRVDLPQPRDRLDPDFRRLVDEVYARMTARPTPGRRPPRDGVAGGAAAILPRVSSNLVAGLAEAIAAQPYAGRADLPALALDLQLEIDELFPVAETLQMLRLGDLAEGDIALTAMGRRFADAAVEQKKKIFAGQLAAHVPLAAHIRRVLDERPAHRAPFSRFREELEDHMSESAAETTLRAVISWGRYAELFEYDESGAAFSLATPEPATAAD